MSGAWRRPPFAEAARTAIALAAPVAQRFVPSRGSTAMSTASPERPTFSPMKSMGASSRSPSPITMVPSMSTVSISLRMASTATWSAYLRSPWPMVRAAAMAALSTTLTNSSGRSAWIIDAPSRSAWPLPGNRGGAIGGQLHAPRLVLSVAEGVVRLHDLVDLAGALVDHRRLGVAVEAAGGVLVGEAVASVDLDAVGGRALALHGGEPLGERGLPRVALPLVLEPARAQPEEPRRVVVGDHLRDHLLHELVLPDGHPERLPALGVGDGGVQAGPDEAGGPRRHRVAAVLEGEHRDLEALPLRPHPVLRGNLDVLEGEAAGVAGEDPPLLLHRVRAEALEGALHDEGGEPAVVALLLLLLVGPRDDEEVVGDVGEADPDLLPVEDVAVALLDRRGLDPHRVGARVGLGEPVGRNLLPLGLGDEVLLLLLLRPP